MNTTYGYARASTLEQEITLLAQQDALKKEHDHRFCATHLWGGTFTDRGQSGARRLKCRPRGFELCLKLERGDVVVMTKLDRGFRNLFDLAGMLAEWREKGVRLVLMDLGVDTGTPVGRIITIIIGAIAEFERERIIERLKDVTLKRKSMGLAVNGNKCYGTKIVGPKGQRRRVRDDASRDLGQKIIEWVDAMGYTFLDVSTHLARVGYRTPRGKTLSKTQAWTIYHREKQLQREDAQQKGGAP